MRSTFRMFNFLDDRIPARFWANVIPEPNSGCWLWLGSLNGGYGQIIRDGKNIRAHRWTYEIAYGPMPSGLETDHLCRTRSCCNPLHLEAVTHQENMARSVGKGVHRGRIPTTVQTEPTTAICVRLPKSLFKMIKKLAIKDGLSLSEFIRDSIHNRIYGSWEELHLQEQLATCRRSMKRSH